MTVTLAPAEPRGIGYLGRGGRARPVTVGLLLVVHLLVLLGVPGPIRAVLVLPAVVLLPGVWVLRLLRLTRPAGWDALLHAVAFGLCVLLAVSFVVAVLPVRGALSPIGCLVGFDVAMAALLFATGHRDRRHPPPAGVPMSGPVLRARLARWRAQPRAGSAAVALAAVAVLLSIIGAVQLNGNRGSTVAVLALTVGAMALLAAAVPAAPGPGAPPSRAREQYAASTVFLLGLAVLLATSLRGVGVTGHDIKIELHVLEATLGAGRWLPGGMAPDYTACLSITTLPAFLHYLLGLAPLDVFRVCYQVLFSVVGVGVFLLARRLLPIGAAVAAAGLFIAFPAFVNDMPMLNRQELALIFFTVAMLALLDQRGPRRHRLVTFVVMALGLTVSHYSSTYVTVGMLLFGWLLLRLPRLRRRPDAAPRARFARGVGRFVGAVPPWRPATASPPLLRFWLVAVLMISSVGWSITSGSGGGLVRTITDTLVAVQRSNGASADAVGYSIFGPRVVRTDQQVLRTYIADRSGGIDQRVLDRLAITCPTLLAPTDVLPVTLAGRALQAVGVAPAAANVWSRRASVVLFQLGALIGAALLWLATRRRDDPARVLAALGGGALVLLAATVVLPQLSLSYGLLRLFQQSLVLLAPLIVLALRAVLAGLGRGRVTAATAIIVTACFVSTSGLLPQFIGGYQPQLNLNNSGPYYHAWYADSDDVALADWAGSHLPDGAVLAADTAQTALLRATTHIDPHEGVAPGIVDPAAYLVATVGPAERVQAVAVADDRILVFTFPLRCVATGRSVLYSRDGHRVYGPASGR